jgi:hypothetical protein
MHTFRVQPLLACIPLALCLFASNARAVDIRQLIEQTQVFGTTTDGNFFNVTTFHLVETRHGNVNVDNQQVTIHFSGQSFFADNLTANAVKFDFKKGIVQVNTPMPGCLGGAAFTMSAINDDIVQTKTKSESKGQPAGKQKSVTITQFRDIPNITGTACGRTFDTTAFNSMSETVNRSVLP